MVVAIKILVGNLQGKGVWVWWYGSPDGDQMRCHRNKYSLNGQYYAIFAVKTADLRVQLVNSRCR